jgi:hypothetical protein
MRLFSMGVPVIASLKSAGSARAAFHARVAAFFTNCASSKTSAPHPAGGTLAVSSVAACPLRSCKSCPYSV